MAMVVVVVVMMMMMMAAVVGPIPAALLRLLGTSFGSSFHESNPVVLPSCLLLLTAGTVGSGIASFSGRRNTVYLYSENCKQICTTGWTIMVA
jgi:hypothetical protein